MSAFRWRCARYVPSSGRIGWLLLRRRLRNGRAGGPAPAALHPGPKAMVTSEGGVPFLDLVQRTLTADISYTISRMTVLERLPGNPIGINYRWVDEKAVALMARLPAFSRVVGLRTGHEGQIEPLVSWYREHDIKPRFEMIPGHYSADLGREMARLNLFQSGFHVSLVGCPTKTAGAADDRITIDLVSLLDRFGHLFEKDAGPLQSHVPVRGPQAGQGTWRRIAG